MDQEGLSLLDIIYSIKEFYAELKRIWYLIVIVCCISSGLGFLGSFYSKKQYVAKSTVMLESSKGGSMSGAMALASQFGMLGSSSSSAITEDKLIEIIKTETIIKSALLEKATIDSTSDLLANHFIDLFGYKEEWKNNNSLKDFRFKNSGENLTVEENGVLKIFYGKIIKDFIIIEKSKSGIISINIETPNELFSKCFNEHLVNAATHFYVDRITEKGRKSLEIVQKRVDSTAIALREAEFTLARWRDASNRLVKAQGMIEEGRLRRNVEIQNTLYLEGAKRLEIAKYSLLDETPFLQTIDKPDLPLGQKTGISAMKGIFLGFILGFILSGGYIFIRKKYASLMREAAINK